MNLQTARERLRCCLQRDAELHLVAPSEIGKDFDAIDAEAPRTDQTIVIALAFWDAWIDERNHAFPGLYPGISAADWPLLALVITSALRSGSVIHEPRILEHFVFEPKAKRPCRIRP